MYLEIIKIRRCYLGIEVSLVRRKLCDYTVGHTRSFLGGGHFVLTLPWIPRMRTKEKTSGKFPCHIREFPYTYFESRVFSW